jgi:hypothetical protein
MRSGCLYSTGDPKNNYKIGQSAYLFVVLSFSGHYLGQVIGGFVQAIWMSPKLYSRNSFFYINGLPHTFGAV